MQAILEGGWLQKGVEPNENEKKGDESAGDEEFDEEKAENKMVQSILNKDNVSFEISFKCCNCRTNKKSKRRSSW